MAWNSPATPVVGQVLTAAFLAAQLRDNMLAIDALLDLATSSFTDGGLLLGSGNGVITAMAVLADGAIVVGDGATDPVALTLLDSSTGQVLPARGGTGLDTSGAATGSALIGTGSGLQINAPVSQVDAEAGTSTTFSAWSSERVKQAIVALTAAHTIASHSDTTGTGAELETLTDGSTDVTLHTHMANEPGTWTPTIVDASNSDSESQAYTIQVGRYIKISNRVFITGTIVTSSLGSLSTLLKIKGLPFAAGSASNAGARFFVDGTALAVNPGENIVIQVIASSAIAPLHIWDNVSGTTPLTPAQYSANGRISFSGFYEV